MRRPSLLQALQTRRCHIPRFVFFLPVILFSIAPRLMLAGESKTAVTTWVDSTLQQLSLREKVGQLFFASLRAKHFAADSDELQEIERLVRHGFTGGIHVWGGAPAAQIELAKRLQDLARIPLLFTADFESGMGPRFEGGTYFPPAMAIAATGDTTFAYIAGQLTAQEARALGIHLTFSPVVDVNNNPLNPVINTRSFGESPERVAAFATAFIRGARSGGLLTTAKHFPGHGDTALDSHLALPVITADSLRLEQVELAPFRATITAGVDAIMTAHINLPSLPMDPYAPATLSREVLDGLLRRKLGFRGLIFTDALEMAAVRARFTEKYAAVAAVQAGADVLLVSPDLRGAMEAVVHAVERGEIEPARIDSSVRRLLLAKYRAGLHCPPELSHGRLRAEFGTADAGQQARACARRALTLLRNRNRLLPLAPGLQDSTIAVIAAFDEPGRYHVQPFITRLRPAFPNLRTHTLLPDPGAATVARAVDLVRQASLVILPVFATLTSGKGTLQLPEPLTAAIAELTATGTPVLAIAFGTPYLISSLPDIDAYLCAYDDKPLMQEVAAEAILGRIPISGHIPVCIPDVCERDFGITLPVTTPLADRPAIPPVLRVALPEEAGFDSDSLRAIDQLMRQAVRDSVFPGASLLIARRGLIVLHGTWGRMGYGVYDRPVPRNAIYDLASLTKVIATTTAAMLLVESSLLDLDAPVQAYLPDFRGPQKDRVTARHLLVHSAGLPPFKRYFLENITPDSIIARILAEPLEYVPGSETRYSDLGVILLGKIIEKLSGQRLDQFCAERIFAPLGMHDTGFTPPASELHRIIPTEYDPWRGRIVHGEVHDENAYALGGVAGHAGLFSTARDLAMLMQMLLNGGEYNGRRLLSPQTISLFTARQNLVPGSSRALGWDTPSERNSSAGHRMSGGAFGHTGFTGTSIWADPEAELFVILLSNRVHPTRENRRIYRLRPRLHDAVMRAMRE